MQSYLDLKEKLEEQKKLEYGQALAELENAKQVRVKLEADRAAAIIFFQQKIQEQINPDAFRGVNQYLLYLKGKILHQDSVVAKAEAEAEASRLRLVEAMKERKMLDTLKDKAHAVFLREEKLAEQKTVDEIVSYSYSKRDNEAEQ